MSMAGQLLYFTAGAKFTIVGSDHLLIPDLLYDQL